jgi:hypothetical protein
MLLILCTFRGMLLILCTFRDMLIVLCKLRDMILILCTFRDILIILCKFRDMLVILCKFPSFYGGLGEESVFLGHDIAPLRIQLPKFRKDELQVPGERDPQHNSIFLNMK